MMTSEKTAAIKSDYDRDGFVHIPGFVAGAALVELHHRAERLATELAARQRQGEDLDPHRKKAKTGMRRTARGNIYKGLQRHDPWFDHQLKAGKHVPLVRALVGDELVPATAAWFTKQCGSTAEIGTHRDAVGLPQGLKAGATIWIALDPADPGNGCLHYGRGSHLLEYAPGTRIGDFDVDPGRVVPATVEPGDAVVHSSLTVHWSHGNPTDRPRRAVSYFYWAASNHTPDEVEKLLAGHDYKRRQVHAR